MPAVVAAALAAYALAEGPVPPLLLKAINSSPKQRLSGVRVIEFRRGPDTIRHEEFVIRDGPRLRIEFPEGSKFAGQIIVENGHDRRHYFPDRNEIHVLPTRRDEALVRLKRLVKGHESSSYSFTSQGRYPIAGVSSELISAKDAYGNLLQKLYIEPKSGVVMRRVLFDRGGAPVGSFQYTKIDLAPTINPSVFTLVRKGARIVTQGDELRRMASEGGFLFRTLPNQTGYRLEHVRTMKPGGQPVLMQVLTNKGRKVSLFQLGTNVDRDQLKRMGRSRTESYSWQEDGRWFVLVGPLSQEDLQRLARMLTDQP
ncbi:MAG TPA: hypothetical protein VGE01_07490 [Fimbriimonas sp.]